MRMVTSNALTSWTRFKESRALHRSEYVEWAHDQRQSLPYRLVFVSHRWITPEHPDPRGEQLLELQQRLTALPMQDGTSGPIVVFYDYCSLPQRPRTTEEESGFYRDLASLESLSRLADQFIILSEGYGDYKNRAWCFFEVITARSNVRFFDDQTHIKEDLDFREFLMTEDFPQITSYDLSYKTNATEAEIIVAVFQHLRACRVTHPDDARLIKDQLIAHYNSRRLTSFGKLVVALNKYFDVEFGMMPAKGGDRLYVCRPFFEQGEWTRMPSLETRPLMMGGRPGPSLFALPRETVEEMGKRHTHGFFPLLRLSLPGIDSVKEFLETFQTSGDWERYVVSPMMIGERGDCFPSIDHAIHTVLQRPPGFFCSKDSRYLYFMLSGR